MREPRARPRSRTALACALLLTVAPRMRALAMEPGDLPRPTSYLTDLTRTLSEVDKQRIESYLASVAAQLEVQFAVAMVPTVGESTPEEFAVRLFENWGVGDRERDDGLLMLIALEDRAVRFETGYGLEGILPDGRLGGILRAEVLPRFRSGDVAGGILAGLQAAAAVVAESKGLPAPMPHTGLRPARRPPAKAPAAMLVTLLFAIIVVATISNRSGRGGGRRRRRNDGMFMGPWWWGGGGWGGGGGFGGGFGGGGGGFGGGGFGGFGGGSSGGGGATGRW